jgi:hypothetical protein
MKETGILFKADMVRAILAKRKRVTRRVIKPQPHECKTRLPYVESVDDYCTGAPKKGAAYYARIGGCWNSTEPFRRPYAPGDRIWVREAFYDAGYSFSTYPEDDDWSGWHAAMVAWYATDGVPPVMGKNDWGTPEGFHEDRKWFPMCGEYFWRSRPSIHMPRWACRLVLPIVSIRAERLKDITDEDAIAEGARFVDFGRNRYGQQLPGWSLRDPFPKTSDQCLPSPRSAFANYVNECYAGPNWNLKPDGDLFEKNPWVWRIEFDPEPVASTVNVGGVETTKEAACHA